MLRVVLILVLFCFQALFASDIPTLALENKAKINITTSTLLVAPGNERVPQKAAELAALSRQFEKIPAIETNGTRYWHLFKLESTHEQLYWLDISNRIVADIRLYQVVQDDVSLVDTTGQYHAPQYPLLYAQQMLVPEGLSFWLVELEHPYFSGNPSLFLRDEAAFKQYAQKNLLIVIGCLGAIFAFSFFNVVVGYWSKNPSYFWYSGYLLSVGFTWTAFFNIFDHFFGLNTSFWNFTVFFLMVLFGTNFYLSFLRMPERYQWLTRLSKAWRFSTLLALGYFIWPLPFHYVITNLVVGVWIILAIVSGIVSLKSGYKPARFYLAGFSFIFLSSGLTILTQAGLVNFIEYTYRFTLITQTIDVVLLSLALADQINVLRHEKESALQQNLETESLARKIEQNAANQLKEANVKLDTALRIALHDKEQKRRSMMLIGHELRTPLQALSALVEEAEAQSDNRFDQWPAMHSATTKLKRHIDNLVTLAETSSGETTTVATSVSVKLMLSSLINDMNVVRLKPIDIELTVMDSVPEFVFVDGVLLKKAISELLDNAVTHSNHQAVRLDVSYDPDQLTFDIYDQGPGIPIELLGEFSQAANGFARETEGLGIGLPIATRIAELLNAQLKLKRLDQGGSLASLSINAPSTRIEKLQRNDRTIKCLLAEDNLINQQVLLKMLQRMNFKTSIANNGKEAVQSILENSYDIILMDLQMPVMDGFEATARIREKGFIGPIIAVTANTEQLSREQAVAVGINDIIGKPVQLKYLESFLANYV